MNEQVKYSTEFVKSYYGLKYRYIDSNNAVLSGVEYATIEDAEAKAKELSNFDYLHIYEVVFITIENVYIGKVFIGQKSSEFIESRWFDNERELIISGSY